MTTNRFSIRSAQAGLIASTVLAAALGLAGTALAQTATPGAASPASTTAPTIGGYMKMDPAKRAERFSQRMAELKAKLQIGAAQEPAWTSFANALRPRANPPQRPDRAAIERMNTPDRIDHMRAMRGQRNAEMDRRADATKAFYGQLTAEQKSVFDTETARLMHRRGHHGGHGGMRGG